MCTQTWGIGGREGGRKGGREGGREGCIPPFVVSIEDVHPEVEHAQAHTEGRPEPPGVNQRDDDVVFAPGTRDEEDLWKGREGGREGGREASIREMTMLFLPRNQGRRTPAEREGVREGGLE